MNNIIWVASYPKSGNTLMRYLLGNYFFNKSNKFDYNIINNHIKKLGYVIMDRRPTKEERLKYDKIVTFISSFDYDAFRTDLDSDIGIWLVNSLTKTFGIEPVKKRTSGGSVPISPFVNTLGIPAVTVPTVNQDNNQHSPNENIRIENYITGIETYLGILTDEF